MSLSEELKSLRPEVIDLSLDRMRRLLAAWGDPQSRLPPVIHVAGTNGKGSCVAFLDGMLRAQGYKVHRYTSPHLCAFNERMVLAGEKISDASLHALTRELLEVNAGRPITFFEATTAIAFTAFARRPADFLLLETGMGGRLDATNVIEDPAACVIMPVSFDHQEYLGTDIAAIAREKAGIIKRGAQVIIAPQPFAEADHVLRAAADRQGAQVAAWSLNPDRRTLEIGGESLTLPGCLGLAGEHQYDNAATAAAALYTLGLLESEWQEGLRQARWPGRLQSFTVPGITSSRHEWRLDGAHNTAGAQVLARFLDTRQERPLALITGFRRDKDVKGFLEILLPYAAHLCFVPLSEGGVPPEELRLLIPDGKAFASFTEAAAYLNDIKEPLNVMCCGSLYLAGEILGLAGMCP